VKTTPVCPDHKASPLLINHALIHHVKTAVLLVSAPFYNPEYAMKNILARK